MKKISLTAFVLLSVLFLFAGYTLKTITAGKVTNTGTDPMTAIQSMNDGYHDPGFKKIVQVALVVRDIEASSKRWAELLGMPVPEISTTRPGHEVKEIYRGKPSEGQVKLTFFNLGQVVIELLQPVSPGTSWQEYLDENGEGVQHLGFQVADLNKTIGELEASGYPVFHRGRYDSDNGDYVYHDTMESLGVIIELLHSDNAK